MKNKKWLAALLTVVMILAMMPCMAFAADTETSGTATVNTKRELDAALDNPNVTTITLGADIDCGTVQIKIIRSVVLDLNGHNITADAMNGVIKIEVPGDSAATVNITNSNSDVVSTITQTKSWSNACVSASSGSAAGLNVILSNHFIKP